MRYGIKNEWIKTISGSQHVNLFITYYMLKKIQATKLKYKEASMKMQSNSSRQIWRQASAKI